MTKARKEIIDIFENSPSPLSALEINNKVKVNKTTIYRELDFLVAQKFITQVNFGDGKVRFEKLHNHHHHLICDTCGKVEDITLDEDKLIKSIKSNNFAIKRHTLEFFGLCSKCQ